MCAVHNTDFYPYLLYVALAEHPPKVGIWVHSDDVLTRCYDLLFINYQTVAVNSLTQVALSWLWVLKTDSYTAPLRSLVRIYSLKNKE